MTKQYQLFEAIGCIDDTIAENAINAVEQRKRKRPLKAAAIVAATAAALTMLSGFMYSNGIAKITLRKGDNKEYNIEYRLTLHEYTIPDEFSPDFYAHTAILPSELFEKFGLTLLTNDNFTDTKSAYRRSSAHGDSNIYTWEPFVAVYPTHIFFDYVLYDKNIGRNVLFDTFYFSDNNILEQFKQFGYGINDDTIIDAEVVRLIDGSPCVITSSEAYFSYNGARYTLRFDYDGMHSSIESLKQVFVDLGIYTLADETN